MFVFSRFFKHVGLIVSAVSLIILFPVSSAHGQYPDGFDLEAEEAILRDSTVDTGNCTSLSIRVGFYGPIGSATATYQGVTYPMAPNSVANSVDSGEFAVTPGDFVTVNVTPGGVVRNSSGVSVQDWYAGRNICKSPSAPKELKYIGNLSGIPNIAGQGDPILSADQLQANNSPVFKNNNVSTPPSNNGQVNNQGANPVAAVQPPADPQPPSGGDEPNPSRPSLDSGFFSPYKLPVYTSVVLGCVEGPNNRAEFLIPFNNPTLESPTKICVVDGVDNFAFAHEAAHAWFYHQGFSLDLAYPEKDEFFADCVGYVLTGEVGSYLPKVGTDFCNKPQVQSLMKQVIDLMVGCPAVNSVYCGNIGTLQEDADSAPGIAFAS